MSVSEVLGERGTVAVEAGTLEYRERGSGPPVVFAHGVGVNGDLWRKVAPELGGDHRCIAPDLPLGGHAIPLTGEHDMSLFGLADILASFLEALDLSDVTLIANDTGGAVSQALVSGPRSGRVGRLVLTSCDAFDRYPPPAVAYLKPTARMPGGLWLLGKAVRLRPVQRLPIAYGWATHEPIEPRIMESYVTGVRTNPGVRRDLGRVLRSARKSDMQRASNGVGAFKGPALVAWAADDKFFPVEHGRRLAELLPAARFELVERSRTFIPEDQPERLVELVREFLPAAG
jgi:pimeloyl-ACP methyl ester carboxylesterase